jgi:hypothetical protein
MNSPFATIFLAIQQRIRTSVPAITYIDQDLGQLKSNSRPPVSWPCTLIDFEDFSFGNMAENVQTAQGTIVLRLGFAPHSSSSAATPPLYQERALSYYDVEWHLHKALQGWSPGTEFGSMARTGVTTQRRVDNYRVRELRYSLAFEDYSTKWQTQLAPAIIIVNEELQWPTT